MSSEPSQCPISTRFWQTRSGIALLVFGAVAVFFLLTEHRAHVLGVLPFVLVLLCPLMHLFHGGHGAHRQQHGDAATKREGSER